MFGLLCLLFGSLLGRTVAGIEESDGNQRKRQADARRAALEVAARDLTVRYVRRCGAPLTPARRRAALAEIAQAVAERTGASLVESADATGTVAGILDSFTH